MLGIIDWGIGGVSIYKLVKEKLGDGPIVYFSDTGATPYGKMTRRELVERLNAAVIYLKQRGVTHLIIACNAASTAFEHLDRAGLEIEGVIEPAVELTAGLKPERLGLIGGRRTVVSGIYRKAFDKLGIRVEQRIAQPLSALIESGDVSSARLREEAGRILVPIRNSSHVLLACTHYPAITELLSELVSSETKFIDPAVALISKIGHWKLAGTGEDEFLTTGDPAQMKRSAKLAFGVDIGRAKKVKL